MELFQAIVDLGTAASVVSAAATAATAWIAYLTFKKSQKGGSDRA